MFVSLLLPYRGDKPPDCSVSIVSNDEGLTYQAGDNELKCSLKLENTNFTLQRNLKNKTVLLK